MTGHVITSAPATAAPATPGTGPTAPAATAAPAAAAVPASASVPVIGGWASLSAAMTAETAPIADRDGLTVSIAPGAAFGNPAVFVPGRAAIEIDGTRLKIDPATAHPERNSDRNRYPVVWGVLVHECAHAKHSVWEAPLVAHPGVVDAAYLLEESRIEAAQIRRRPDDRHWLRASATEILIGDNGGAIAAAQIPATPYNAARNAALILARHDGGILDAAECAPAATAIEAILGTDTLDKLRAIWREAHTVTDNDTAAMLELGQQWFDLVGPDPHTDPDPASVLGAAIGATVTNIGNAVAASPAAPDPAEIAAAEREAAEQAADEAEKQARKVFGDGSGRGRTASRRRTRSARPEERTAARVLARALNTASTRERVAVKTTSAVPPGRLRMRGALAREAQRAAGALPTAKPFTRTTRKPVPVPPLRVGIACDVSSSMADYAAPVASAAWIIAYAAELATMAAETATVTFGASVTPITYPGTTPARVTEFSCPDYQHVIGSAVNALDGALGLARPGATRLLVIISDGFYYGTERGKAQRRVDALRAAGCAVLWLAPKNPDPDADDPAPLDGVTVHMVSDLATTAAAIGRAITAAVRAA
ncbi:VWA domain containing CoxE-like protein [Nocardia amikacinitolerans]|uniref:VWA domain-containing protein n=1 Tax=Nocardia amikacinitolerans TaxID=756689 RepID=UPI000AEC6BDE|nr:VWA domain-containing protein [Nocardia amikacinitolerans]MCP2320952.1 VWA domain containing CoxE-like protein [Nocardia amikacinitolerans]